ncbi:MAG: redox-sensing transcriptional repressor Rex [Halanaerobiales bacterium]
MVHKKLSKKGIPISVIKRLPIYYRYLGKIAASGIEKISSKQLAEKLGVTASQIRHDLNYFGSFGERGYGYHVKDLKKVIGEILGTNNKMNMVLVGAGNLGNAIANYPNFIKRGFIIKAVFDSDPDKTGKKLAGCRIGDISYLEEYLEDNSIDIGILAIPAEEALYIARIFEKSNVKGLWNFAPVSLNLESTLVENVHISESLMTLAYQIKEFE